MASVRVYVKKQLSLGRLTLRQNQMFKIGNVAVAALKHRVGGGLGPDDSRAMPLTKRYAIWKSRHGLSNRRNLSLTGNMLRNFMVRTVSDVRAAATNSTRKDRDKARGNQNLQPWIVFSPRSTAAVTSAANQVLAEIAPTLPK